MVFLFPPLKPPSPQISVAKVLIVCFCHDKRLRVFLSLIQLFFTISIVVLIFVFFIQNVFFLFLRNVLLPIEILKIKILEHSDPPSQHFFVHKAFIHFFFCRGKVMLCHLAEWHNGKNRHFGRKPEENQNNNSCDSDNYDNCDRKTTTNSRVSRDRSELQRLCRCSRCKAVHNNGER